ncbi:MAG TPA: oligopeptide/dipeptide ABC transporter ATP-binding protein [Streptosporangiaceae bacterium]|nr:oligopeptide/dipeptide ABC transporter ATP-binding protein [Streptosporangiaceae bacterium]
MPTKPETGGAVAEAAGGEVLLDVRDLHVQFALRGGWFDRFAGRDRGSVRAVDGVSFGLRRGEVLGLVGESGSGKTTLGRALLGLVPPTSGSIRYEGRELVGLAERRLRPLRRELQMVFQDPHASLNPSMDLERAVGHPLQIHGLAADDAARREQVSAALERVGLAPVERFLGKFPGDLSGGQKQRAVLARATILDPKLIVADEPVSMLDMSVRAKILELMLDLKRQLGLTYVYITHDLGTAKFFCDRVAIMYLGRIVEIGPTEEIFADPKHPYTRSLLAAVPEPDPRKSLPRDVPRGEVPDAAVRPGGCSFHPRCPAAFEVCGWEGRDLRALLEQRWTELPEEEFLAEAATVGDLPALDGQTGRVVVRPGGGKTPEDVAALLATVRRADPAEPLWRGVRAVRADGAGHVVTEFFDGVDPGLVAAGGVEVACHLHDPEMTDRARRLAAERED